MTTLAERKPTAPTRNRVKKRPGWLPALLFILAFAVIGEAPTQVVKL